MNIFWNIYKNIERELIEISNIIHIDDNQLSIYSPKITELLIRTVVEVEAISKELYFENGGDKENDNQLFFDTDCIDFLEKKWLLSKKKVIVSASNFYFNDENNKVLTPLKKANKRGSSSSKWLIAYQAVKHNRNNSLSKGNLKNLIEALAGLYVLNIYYKDLVYSLYRDSNGTNFDNSLGSSIFSVDIHKYTDITYDNEKEDMPYKKSINYDSSVYIMEPTQKSKDDFKEQYSLFISNFNKEIVDRKLKKIENCIKQEQNIDENKIQEILENIKSDKSIEEELFQEKRFSAFEMFTNIEYQAVVNKQQY
ncbi:hypothetical protein [Capnocytophaga sp. oral taxon 326]|uniref:hypothetical protein n=1 Tax=Capnocytophaga sp. oral taxon 326 TaxID=712212 RepID=UPI0002A1BAEA|nr:hypothetical protein [Capnocytophaga sp. oral taxon 326]EKY17589.1 hypothetical protein HMPREF9073_01445 [Capnocytophaga sp. oral taxon 326 str. F0382]